MCAMLFSSLSREFAMKEESMTQTVPVSPTTCDYSHFTADSFDLSLLGSPADGEVPYSPTSIHQLLARYSDGPCSPPLMFHSPPHVKEEPLPAEEDLELEADDEEAHVVDQQLLREFLRDMTFQRRLNVRPFQLDALPQQPVDGLDHEQTLSLTIQQLRQDVDDTFSALDIASSTAVPHVKEEPLPAEEDRDQEVGAEVGAGDHQLLREVLRDTSFQRRHNVRPLDLDTLAQEAAQQEPLYTVRHEQIEPVLSLAIQQLRQDVDDTCSMLGIASDPSQWTVDDVKAWLLWTLRQYNLPMIPMEYFAVDGAVLSSLTEQEFQRRSPQCGSMLYAQLEIWKAACQELESRLDSNPWSNTTMAPNSCSSGDMSEDEEEESVAAASPPAVTGCSGGSTGASSKVTRGASHIHLWQFLKELLASPQVHGSCIRWLERNKGVFKIEDSVRVARLWGKRKNRPAMNYDKLSRSIRQYYKKGIMKKTERSQRLVYQFCHPYCL